MPPIESIQLQAQVPEEAANRRFDQVLAELFPDYSRSRLSAWVKEGRVRLDGAQVKPRFRLKGGEQVELAAEPVAKTAVQAQAIDLDIVHEDAAILVINKPPGLVVHPAAGNPDGTLQNALLHHAADLAVVPRSGLVHRLDKDTSGLLVVAKTLKAHHALVKQLQARTMGREYDALVRGVMTAGGQVDAPLGRHPVQRKRMAVIDEGKPALTHYRLRERYRAHTRLKLRLESGRTHQIRVHMAHIRHPVLGDPVYGGRPMFPKGADEDLREALQAFRRQALHAEKLTLMHPDSGEEMQFQTPCPAAMASLMQLLREDAVKHS